MLNHVAEHCEFFSSVTHILLSVQPARTELVFSPLAGAWHTAGCAPLARRTAGAGHGCPVFLQGYNEAGHLE